jgi:putative ABC transport system permease protein
MKYLRLIWRNAIRNKRRAILTILSIAIAIVAISILDTILYAFNAGVEMADESRLVTRNATSIIFQLPLACEGRIARMSGVRQVAIGNWFGGVYQDKKNFFAKFAVDAPKYFSMYPEYVVAPAQFAEFLRDRKGCIIGRKLAAKYGFRVGQTVPIEGDIYPGTWEFNVCGIYEGTRKSVDETVFFFHWKYLDESLPKVRQGQVGFYITQLENPVDAGRVSKEIDAEFENSPDRTLTETEKAFQLEFVRMIGNIELLVRAIGSAVVFAILLVAANTMAMAIRERTMEIAILKTLGFRNTVLSIFIVGESLALAFLGWLVGTGVAWFFAKGVERAFSTFFPVFSLKPQTVAWSLGIGLLTGILASLFPVVHAMRIRIVDAMREVA